MTKTRMHNLFACYKQVIFNLDPKFAGGMTHVCEMDAAAYQDNDPPKLILLNHLAWMCVRAQTFLIHNNPEDFRKAATWLGYIQGELRALKLFTVNELREHSRTHTKPRIAELLSDCPCDDGGPGRGACPMCVLYMAELTEIETLEAAAKAKAEAEAASLVRAAFVANPPDEKWEVDDAMADLAKRQGETMQMSCQSLDPVQDRPGRVHRIESAASLETLCGLPTNVGTLVTTRIERTTCPGCR